MSLEKEYDPFTLNAGIAVYLKVWFHLKIAGTFNLNIFCHSCIW